jgi:hypothetical protein
LTNQVDKPNGLMVSIMLPLAFTSTSYDIIRKERTSNGGGGSAGFTYRLDTDRLKPRASRFMVPTFNAGRRWKCV